MNKSVNIAYKVSLLSILINVFLTIIKFIAGIVSHSNALVSDAVHSLSDVLSTVVVLIGIKFSLKKADEKHPYGHERMECVAAIILTVLLFLVGFIIGYKGIISIINKNEIIIPGIFALVAAFISIVVKELMYRYTISASKKINSEALKADAWHHRSDALSSIGSLVGIIGARLGFPFLDSVASIIICLFIFKVSFDIFKDAIDKMVDKSCSKETINKIENIIKKEKKIKHIDDLKTRQFGNKYYIDVEIAVDEDITVKEGHTIAENLHDTLENKLKDVKHCMVHVNPYSKNHKI